MDILNGHHAPEESLAFLFNITAGVMVYDNLRTPILVHPGEALVLRNEANQWRLYRLEEEEKMPEEMTVSVKVSQKIQPRQFESAEVQLEITGVTMVTTEADMDEMIDQGKLAYTKIVERLRKEVSIIRDNKEV